MKLIHITLEFITIEGKKEKEKGLHIVLSRPLLDFHCHVSLQWWRYSPKTQRAPK